jgi:N-hydroxyarylamine O-acetyltransferase
MTDLDAYLRRIGYDGPRTPTVAVLRALHRRHALSIPFENLGALGGHAIDYSLPALVAKLVQGGRGGYCFEQSHLFLHMLRAFGFSAMPLIGRVRPVGATAVLGLTHMLLRVDCEGRSFFADVGYGNLSLLEPLALKPGERQVQVGLEPRRLVAEGPLLVHQAELKGVWTDIYAFSPQEAPAMDFEIGNWYTSTYPESRFVRNLIAVRLEPDRRHTLLNREYHVRFAGDRVESRTLSSPAELHDVLTRRFGLSLPAGFNPVCAELTWSTPASPG